MDDPQPEWELAGGRLRHALREHRDLFLDKSEFSMDWYYPVLGGAVRGDEADALLAARWDEFVVPGLGRPLRLDQPVGHRRRDLRAGAGPRRARRPRARAGGCSPTCSTCARTTAATGPATSTPTGVNWPAEHSTYTAAAVVLAADALADATARRRHHARHARWCAASSRSALECGCAVSRPASRRPAPRRTA